MTIGKYSDCSLNDPGDLFEDFPAPSCHLAWTRDASGAWSGPAAAALSGMLDEIAEGLD